jgi:peptide/nickel transport system permease protein
MFFGLGVGVLLGMLSAYAGSFVDNIIMRIIDLLMSFPFMLLAITMVTILGFGTKNVVIAIGVANTPGFARLTRSQVLGIMENEYVISARSIGAPHYIILTRYILLNCVSPILIYGTLQLGRAILTEAALSYIGLGVQPPNPSWGILVSEGQNYLNSYPYLALIPGFMIMVTVFCVNIIGDRLRDVLDPKRTRLK